MGRWGHRLGPLTSLCVLSLHLGHLEVAALVFAKAEGILSPRVVRDLPRSSLTRGNP